MMLPLYCFFLFVLFAVLSNVVYGVTAFSTREVADTLPVLFIFLTILFFCLTAVFFGINFLDLRNFFSPHNFIGISMIAVGSSFFGIIINTAFFVPDLNEQSNLLMGGIFGVSILVMILSIQWSIFQERRMKDRE